MIPLIPPLPLVPPQQRHQKFARPLSAPLQAGARKLGVCTLSGRSGRSGKSGNKMEIQNPTYGLRGGRAPAQMGVERRIEKRIERGQMHDQAGPNARAKSEPKGDRAFSLSEWPLGVLPPLSYPSSLRTWCACAMDHTRGYFVSKRDPNLPHRGSQLTEYMRV